MCVYSTLYIKEVHTSSVRFELRGGKEVENDGALISHKENVFTLEPLKCINKMFTETIAVLEIIISIFYLYTRSIKAIKYPPCGLFVSCWDRDGFGGGNRLEGWGLRVEEALLHTVEGGPL